MRTDMLTDALEMAKASPILVATADADGLPHVACAGRLEGGPEGCVVVSEWFCPGTLANLGENPRIAVVVWDEAADEGHQLLGRVQDIERTEVLDGYVPGREEDVPQVLEKLTVRVSEILAFSRAPHTDREE